MKFGRLVVMAALLTVSAPFSASAQMVFFGLPHEPFNAKLTPDASGLHVCLTDPGGAGMGGVVVGIGQAESGAPQFDGFSENAPGATLHVAARGNFAGFSDSYISSFTFRIEDDRIDLRADFTPFNATGFVVTLMFGDVVLIEETVSREDVATTFPEPSDGEPYAVCKIVEPILLTQGPRQQVLTAFVDLPVPAMAAVPGHPPVLTDRVGLQPVFPQQPPRIESVTSIEIAAADAECFTITAEAVGLFGLPWHALGEAHLDPQPGALAVSNIGSGGGDGARIELSRRNRRRAAAIWLFIDPNKTPFSSFIEASAAGTLAHQPHRPLGSTRATFSNSSTVEFTADYADLDSPTQLVQVYSAGKLRASLPQQTGILAETDTWPEGCRVNPANTGGPVSPRHAYSWTWSVEVPISLTGSGETVLGDELRLIAEGGGGGQGGVVTRLDRVNIRAADVPEITFISATTTAVCDADFDGNDAVTSDDYFAFLAAFFASHPAADVDASGTIDSNDYFEFLSRFFAGCP